MQTNVHTKNGHVIKQHCKIKTNADVRPIYTKKTGREIYHQDKVITRLDELYTEIYVGKQNTIIHTDAGRASGKDHINIDTLN